MKLTAQNFKLKWNDRFANNDDFLISEADMREFAADAADSFGQPGLIRTGTNLEFDRNAWYPPIATGCFSVDVSTMVVGVEVRVVLEPGATLPTTAPTTTAGVTTPAVLDPAVFHTTSDPPTAGKRWEYLFVADFGGKAEYIVTDLS